MENSPSEGWAELVCWPKTDGETSDTMTHWGSSLEEATLSQ